MIVPGLYANKSVKWLQRVLVTNNPQLNDTYAEWNNDTESQLKTCASFHKLPERVSAGRPVVVTGVAQVGMSGLGRVQCFLHSKDAVMPAGDPGFSTAAWKDAEVQPPPADWGGGLPHGKLPGAVMGFSADAGRPVAWPMRDSIVHWKVVLTNLVPGDYDLRCRTIDANGMAQPMPRPFLLRWSAPLRPTLTSPRFRVPVSPRLSLPPSPNAPPI